MATFQKSRGVLSETWASSVGAGNLRRWTCSGICTDLQDTFDHLGADQVWRCQFVPVPHRRLVVCKPLDGRPVVTATINVCEGPIWSGNTNRAIYVPYCVKLGPVIYASHAPRQLVDDLAGKALLTYRVEFQQIQLNA